MNSSKKFSILIVDDERSNLDVLMHILKPDYGVRVAKSGLSALKVAMEHQPDLILLDILMPDMSGFDVLRALKESDRTRHIPAIFVTGLSRVEDEERGFHAGAVDYIVKPFNHAIVKARVETHLKIIKQMRMIERLGMIDALTDIANRRSFDNQLSIEWRRSVREGACISLLILDVDHFKKYNDTHGHPQGDRLLQLLARIMAGSLKRSTDLAARLGGEEFAVILPATPLEGARMLAESIRKNIEESNLICGHCGEGTGVTVSIGVASMVPTMENKSEELMAKADAKLYEAKLSGRNRVRA